MAIVFMLIGFFIWIVCVRRFPSIIIKTALWEPPRRAASLPLVLVVEMGSDKSFPQLWRSVGSFIDSIAEAGITVISYGDIDAEMIEGLNPRALILTGYHQPLSTYDLGGMSAFFAYLRATQLPVLGICGGHQFIGLAYGARIVEMGFEEKGYIRFNAESEDPIFGGITAPVVYNCHSLMVDRVPDEFVLLGRNARCIQAVRHAEKRIYGIQFHPEFADKFHQDGSMLVQNFLRLSGVRVKKGPISRGIPD
jgi:GMP synthase-like glutamine amidotransferase